MSVGHKCSLNIANILYRNVSLGTILLDEGGGDGFPNDFDLAMDVLVSRFRKVFLLTP